MTSRLAVHAEAALRGFGARRAVLSALAALLIGCASSDTTNTAPPVTTPSPVVTVTSVTVAGGSTGKVGETSQLTATAIMSDGTNQAVTSLATWESANTAIATVSATGLAAFVAAGGTDIKATYKSVMGTLHLTISQLPLPTPHYDLSGTVTAASTGGVLVNGKVRVVDGPDAGRSATTDSGGKYAFSQLTAGTFTLTVTHADFKDLTRQVTLSSNLQLDFAMDPSLDLSGNYGTFNVSLSLRSDSCEFPPMPGSSGTVKLSGQNDGTGFSFSITERGTTRDYSGFMNPNGSFQASGSNVFAGAPVPTHGPSFITLMHDSSGSVSGSVTGRQISGSEDVTFGDPCPGRMLSLTFNGSK